MCVGGGWRWEGYGGGEHFLRVVCLMMSVPWDMGGAHWDKGPAGCHLCVTPP